MRCFSSIVYLVSVVVQDDEIIVFPVTDPCANCHCSFPSFPERERVIPVPAFHRFLSSNSGYIPGSCIRILPAVQFSAFHTLSGAVQLLRLLRFRYPCTSLPFLSMLSGRGIASPSGCCQWIRQYVVSPATQHLPALMHTLQLPLHMGASSGFSSPSNSTRNSGKPYGFIMGIPRHSEYIT